MKCREAKTWLQTGSVRAVFIRSPADPGHHSRPRGRGGECSVYAEFPLEHPFAQLQNAHSHAHLVSEVDTCPAEQKGVWRPRKPVHFQEAPCPPWRRQQGEPPGWQGDEGPVAFITRERLDQHKLISPSGKTAPGTCPTANTQSAVGQPGPSGAAFLLQSFCDKKKGIS